MSNNLTSGAAGGTHVSGAPLTLPLMDEAAPGLLQNSIDERIVKVRPTSTPIDQISRCAGARTAKSMTVEYYSVDTKATETTLSTLVKGTSGVRKSDDITVFTLKTADDSIFEVSETILVPEVIGYAPTGKQAGPLMFYVMERLSGGGISCAVVNGTPGEDKFTISDLPSGSRIVRMGRAATELDVQTAQFSALPRKASNNCQIFKMQVEQSTLAKIAAKEVGWGFSDQEEAAIIDMRLGMEKNFLFGTRARLTNRRSGDETMLTEGIWTQAGGSFTFEGEDITHADLVSLMRRAFTGAAAGSNRKILVAGSGLIERINRLDPGRTVGASDKVTRWGIDFSEINSKFGTLYVVHSEVFDSCGHDNDGLILDPDYVTKYSFIPLKVESLDLKGSGVRNVDATVITEASCVVLRHPKAHIRVIGG